MNQVEVAWGIAAGTAVYIYAGGKKEDLDDVDLWISAESRETAAKALGKEWQPQASDNHRAENISFNGLDIFTNLKRVTGEEVRLNYRWTTLVNEHLFKGEIEKNSFWVISPEDVVVMKIVNSRGNDKEDILALDRLGLDKDYLRKRLSECGVTITFNI